MKQESVLYLLDRDFCHLGLIFQRTSFLILDDEIFKYVLGLLKSVALKGRILSDT